MTEKERCDRLNTVPPVRPTAGAPDSEKNKKKRRKGIDKKHEKDI